MQKSAIKDRMGAVVYDFDKKKQKIWVILKKFFNILVILRTGMT